jgi:hypothetical protein
MDQGYGPDVTCSVRGPAADRSGDVLPRLKGCCNGLAGANGETPRGYLGRGWPRWVPALPRYHATLSRRGEIFNKPGYPRAGMPQDSSDARPLDRAGVDCPRRLPTILTLESRPPSGLTSRPSYSVTMLTQ